MARQTKHELNKAKAAKQKKIAIVGGVVFVALLAIQGPRTLKMLHGGAKAPVVASTTADGTTTTPAPATPAADPNSLAAPTLGGVPTTTTTAAATSELVSAVPMTVDSGQLESFQRFVSKDPFKAQVTAGGSTGGSGAAPSPSSPSPSPSKPSGGSSAPPPSVPVTTPPSHPAAPTTAVISLNGELMSVPANSDFPTSGATFDRTGVLFHLISLTAKTAKIAVAGGSYADGSSAITLHVKTPLTLQNTADGSKYTLILEPPNTPVTSSASTTTTAKTPAAVPAVPAGNGG